MALTDKQEMFCREYLIDLNATQAAIRAGYSKKTANRTASENLSKPDIQLRISELKLNRNERIQIDADYVLKRLVDIDQMDVLDTRYQAKGSYQPSGDYATNTALNNGLNNKLNTSSVVQSTGASTTSVMSQKAVTDALQNAVNLNTIYPIGIVVWFAQNKNPNTLFPGTKWQYIGENKTIRLAAASGANVLTTGGSDSITLTEAQMPTHNHSFSATTSSFDYGTKTTNSAGAHTHGQGLRHQDASKVAAITSRTGSLLASGAAISITSSNYAGYDYLTSSSGAHTHTVAIGSHTHTISGTTGNKGSGSTITVTNAYITLMGWYRTS